MVAANVHAHNLYYYWLKTRFLDNQGYTNFSEFFQPQRLFIRACLQILGGIWVVWIFSLVFGVMVRQTMWPCELGDSKYLVPQINPLAMAEPIAPKLALGWLGYSYRTILMSTQTSPCKTE